MATSNGVTKVDRTVEFQMARRGTYLKINLNRILENLKIIQSRCAEHTDIIAVVKGNAYGHGSVAIAKCMEAHGYSHFAVATALEGEELRKAGVLGHASLEEIPTLYEHHLTPTVADLEFVNAWGHYIRQQDSNNPKDPTAFSRSLVIKVDTGMSRNGCEPDFLPQLVKACKGAKIPIHSMMTHFAQSWDGEDLTRRQYDLFMKTVDPFRKEGIKLHVANSGAILNGVGTDLDYVRPGMAVYGLAADPTNHKIDLVRGAGLKPTIEWLAKPTLIKNLEANRSVGYNHTYRCSKRETIAVFPFGIGDGYSSRNFRKGVLTTIDGTVCPVVGSISMDTVTVKLPEAAKDAREFYVMSADYNDVNSCYAIARNVDVGLAALCGQLRARLPRLYEISEVITSQEHSF